MLNRAILPIFAATLLCCASAAWSQPAPQNFPDGPGKDIVVATCGGCHAINRLRAGYTPAGWNMLQHMMQNMGAPIAPEDWPVVTTYLMKNFPEKARPPAVLIAGPVQVTIKMWDVPTLGPARMTRSPPRMARSGGPDSCPTSLGGSIPRPALCGNTA